MLQAQTMLKSAPGERGPAVSKQSVAASLKVQCAGSAMNPKLVLFYVKLLKELVLFYVKF